MPAVAELRAPARSSIGTTCGVLRIAVLPKQKAIGLAPLVERAGDASVGEDLAPYQLVEGIEYRYEWEEVPANVLTVETDPEEIFQPDTKDGKKGRLRPGLFVGTIQVVLRNGTATLGQLELEVRSRKLNYLSEYRWMLRDIANQMTELVMDRFAASGSVFSHEDTRDAVTLYQRFAFLRALISSESFQLALGEILRRPHVSWDEQHTAVRPGQSLKAESYVVRQLLRSGKRAQWPGGPIKTIPVRLERRHTEATQDTTPNRFVKFAFERWRQVIADIDRGLGAAPASAITARGRREVSQVLEQIEVYLHQDLFKDLGPIARFPSDDQVLLRREGYRDVYRAYLEFELASRLSWRGADAAYSAGQRDVAVMYEYWAFLQLAQVVASLAGKSFDLRPLIDPASDGLNVVLQTGKETVVSGILERFGRRIAIELCFNKTFGKGTGAFGSWTRPMRPDYSLIVTTPKDEPAAFEPVVLLFDAKYRVDFIAELFGQGDELATGEGFEGDAATMGRGGAQRADLLKMHAYRDAIRRSAGAYVLYPGGDDESNLTQYSEYQEVLPGLGAFVLRPSLGGGAVGVSTLKKFLDEVLDHVATRLTRHERGRYWLEESYANYEVPGPGQSTTKWSTPKPDTTVLLGYVKSAAHWNWIQKRKAYNVRSAGRSGGVLANAELLFSQVLVLYCPANAKVAIARIISDPEEVVLGAMVRTGYPNPSSDYLCVQLNWLSNQKCVAALNAERIDEFVKMATGLKGAPLAVEWATLARM